MSGEDLQRQTSINIQEKARFNRLTFTLYSFF